VHYNADGDGSHERPFNGDPLELGLERTTGFSREHRREYEGLRGVCTTTEAR